MTPEEAIEAGKDARPIEEKVAAAVESTVREALAEFYGEIVSNVEDQHQRWRGEVLESVEQLRQLAVDEISESVDEWANLLIEKSDRVRANVAQLGTMLGVRRKPAEEATLAEAAPTPAVPLPPTGPPTLAEQQPNGRQLSPEEVEAAARLARVRAEEEKEAAEFEATRGKRRFTLDGEGSDFPEDMRVLND